ncbi:hypothetical protein SDC9_197189 [bioreactor metagenome]|uniref:Uncharacterized protein n=1 Tax=bioreactor metagenome TaxID=1076179 RepID=A0A645IE77_9ZZZZ
MGGIFAKIGSFAVAVFSHRKQVTALADDVHPNHIIAGSEGDSAYAAGGPSHRANVVFVEADGLAHPGHDDHLIAAVGQLHFDEFVPFV